MLERIMFARFGSKCRSCAKLKKVEIPNGSRVRRYTTTQNPASTPIPQSKASAIGLISSDLDNISPGFSIRSDQVKILREPAEFYDTLKDKILKAKRYIYISTLYIGKTEHELINTLAAALRQNAELRLSILIDALRGTRETPNASCASLLAPLIEEFGEDRVEIRMYHTPNLTGIRKAIVPKRINEGWGLQHMKLYGFDDELILSGANLSQDYFTNRQDRYHVFSSKYLTDYFAQIHASVCSLSFKILPSNDPAGYVMSWPDSNAASSPLENPAEFRKKATALLAPLLRRKPSPSSLEASTTTIYPVLQFTPLLKPDSSTELPALQSILHNLAATPLLGSKWTFTAGYFNMTPGFRRLLLATKSSKGTVVAASPWANGFYGSPGISGLLPAAYTLLSRRFVETVRRQGLSEQIKLKEWRRGSVTEPDGWTYHAKGLWVTLPGDDAPSVSIVGSSNYTKRSYELDLEANVVIVTSDEALKKRLGEEEKWLQEYAKEVDESEYRKAERHVSWKVKLAMWTVRVLGGAL